MQRSHSLVTSSGRATRVSHIAPLLRCTSDNTSRSLQHAPTCSYSLQHAPARSPVGRVVDSADENVELTGTRTGTGTHSNKTHQHEQRQEHVARMCRACFACFTHTALCLFHGVCIGTVEEMMRTQLGRLTTHNNTCTAHTKHTHINITQAQNSSSERGCGDGTAHVQTRLLHVTFDRKPMFCPVCPARASVCVLCLTSSCLSLVCDTAVTSAPIFEAN